MEQWFNLFVRLAKPIFATLVYTGTNALLDSFQDELDKQQKERARWILKSLGIREDNKRENQSIAGIFASEVEENYDERLWEITDRATAATLQLPELHKTLEHWPLRLFPAQLRQSCRSNYPIPLQIAIAPPQIPREAFEQMGLTPQAIEPRLSQSLREFLSQYYSFHCPVRPTEFLGGAWKGEPFYGEASIKALFSALQSTPMLILESEIEGDRLIFRLAYWGLAQERYCYETLFKLPYRDFLEESAKTRALAWRATRDRLLALGKDAESINRLGGERVANLTILEELEALREAGIDPQTLELSYRIDNQDFEALCEFLSHCHCLVAGWIVDIYYLIHYNRPPHLPQWLPQLESAIADRQSKSAITQATVAIYQNIFNLLARERPQQIALLALQLAQSLLPLPNKSLAKEQVNYSLQLWLQQHQLSHLSAEICPETITQADREYLEMLQSCLSALEDESSRQEIETVLKAIPVRYDSEGAIALFKRSIDPDRQIKFILRETIETIPGKSLAIVASSEGHKAIVKKHFNLLELWHLGGNERHTLASQLTGHSGKIVTVSLSPDGQILATSDKTRQRNHIKVWNLQSGKLDRTLFGHKQTIYALAISSRQLKGKPFLASGSHKIKLWDLQTGESLLTLFGHKEWVYSLAISPDGKTSISGSKDKTIRLWNLPTGNLVRTLDGHEGSITMLGFDPDGQTFVSGSEDGTIKRWNLETGKCLQMFIGHEEAVRTVAISPDCQSLISGSDDKTIKVWSLRTGELRQTLTGHQNAVGFLSLSPNGETLVSGDGEMLKIWQTHYG